MRELTDEEFTRAAHFEDRFNPTTGRRFGKEHPLEESGAPESAADGSDNVFEMLRRRRPTMDEKQKLA